MVVVTNSNRKDFVYMLHDMSSEVSYNMTKEIPNDHCKRVAPDNNQDTTV